MPVFVFHSTRLLFHFRVYFGPFGFDFGLFWQHCLVICVSEEMFLSFR